MWGSQVQGPDVGFSLWSPETWFGHKVQLLRLPPAARAQVWKRLNRTDRGNIRLTSRALRSDVDLHLGVSVRINGARSESGSPSTRLEWIQSVAVRSLKIQNLDSLTLEPTTLLKHPGLLNRLTLELSRKEFDGPRTAMLKGLLNVAHELRSLRITQAIYGEVQFLEPYSGGLESHVNLRELVAETLQNIASMSNLKELILRVNLYDSYRLRGFQIEPEPSFRPDLIFSLKLLVLRLRLPLLHKKEEMMGWKRLLDSQDQLLTFEVDFGWLRWDFCSECLKGSAKSLRELRLPVIDQAFHFSDHVTEAMEPSQEAVVKEFDWSVLSQSSMEVVQVWSADPSRLIRTLGFQELNLRTLRDLELSLVQLTDLDMQRIFVGGKALRSLKLICWAPEEPDPGTPEAGLQSKVNLAVLLSSVLAVRRLERAVLEDYCLACRTFDMADTIGHVAGITSYNVAWKQKVRIHPWVGPTAVLTVERDHLGP